MALRRKAREKGGMGTFWVLDCRFWIWDWGTRVPTPAPPGRGTICGDSRSGRDAKPVEPLRRQSAAEVGRGQEGADAVGHGGAGDVRPVGGAHRTAQLQLIRFTRYGRGT